MQKKIFILLFYLIIFGYTSFAAHIVGGEMYYESLGNNQYKITMKVYRDCASGGAEFDDFAYISVYRGSVLLTENLNVPVSDIKRIQPRLDNPCLEPPPVCVQEGVYETVLTLPLSNSDYTISYQRCCRNNSITNIATPGDVGSTYTISITNAAQRIQNSSPRFQDFPPIVICNQEPLNFDHSAIDANGHRLEYAFCTPIQGGGNDLSNPTTPTGVRPRPATPPPYTPVFFIPPYNANSPMGGSPTISINPVTGVISGKPIAQGQFVVGVCVREFDANGVLLSTLQRDFQFNVVNCVVTVYADIREDEKLSNDTLLVRSCGNRTVTLVNESGLANNIRSYDWFFDLKNGSNFISNVTNPTITFPNDGRYYGYLIVNKGSQGCTDTAQIAIDVYPEIRVDFNYSVIGCEAGEVGFRDSSYSGSGFITRWLWDFADGSTSNQANPSHSFAQAGEYNVKLTVIDTNGCRATIAKPIKWFPAAKIAIEIDPKIGCEPLAVLFQNNSSPINGYDILWDFGDGNTSKEESPTHTYLRGVYTVSLAITSPLGCVSRDTFVDVIRVSPRPTAAFDYTPKNLTYYQRSTQFTDFSTDAAAWEWNFGNGNRSSYPNPRYTFPDTGYYPIQLIVTHASGCRDTATKIVDVAPIFTYYLPNAFTPNFDGINDGYRGTGLFYGIEKFELLIFNRWGECIFQTNDPTNEWDGTKNNSGGTLMPTGVYICLVNITGERGKKFNYKAFATLIH